MSVEFKVVGDRNIAVELQANGKKITDAMDGVMKRAALRVANRIVRIIQRGSRSGIQYSRPGGTTHTASAPGEPPKSDSGFLAKHVRPTTVKDKGNVVSASVIVSASYAGFLEEGTSKMKARPFVEPAFQLENPETFRDAARTIKKALSSGG